MLVQDVCAAMEKWAPIAWQESYDNSGLLVGQIDTQVTGILISLDCTEEVVDEAIKRGCNMIVSHHPIIFKGLKKITGANYVEKTVFKAIQNYTFRKFKSISRRKKCPLDRKRIES